MLHGTDEKKKCHHHQASKTTNFVWMNKVLLSDVTRHSSYIPRFRSHSLNTSILTPSHIKSPALQTSNEMSTSLNLCQVPAATPLQFPPFPNTNTRVRLNINTHRPIYMSDVTCISTSCSEDIWRWSGSVQIITPPPNNETH